MKNYMIIIRIIFGVSLLSISLAAIEISSMSMAVDVAGKQRMLTQKMLKDYVMIGMKNNFGNPSEDLDKTISAFGDHMQSLYDFTDNKEVRGSIELSQKLWIDTKKMLEINPSKENAKKLQASLEKLLKAADATTKLFAKLTGKEFGEIVNISGRQRMLSQRIASLYVMKSWDIEDPEFATKMRDSMALFRNSLDRLLSYEGNDTEIKLLLKKVDYNFKFFEFMGESQVSIPTLLYKKSMNILKDMNTATGLYAQK